MLKLLLRLLLGIGIVGFLTPFLLLPRLGSHIDRLELPTRFETAAIRLPDGARLTATIPLARLQLYDQGGRFVRGWFVESGGKSFTIGLSARSEIVVCSAHKHTAWLFDLDGRRLGDARACKPQPWRTSGVMYMGDAEMQGVELAHPITIAIPPPSLPQWLLLPLWHPIVAWAMMLLGGLLLNWFYPQPRREAWFQMRTKPR